MKVLVFQTAFIGDVILCTPMIKALADEGHSVGAVVKPEAANLLERDTNIKVLHVYDKRGSDKGIKGMLRIISMLKAEKYDAAVIPHRSIRSAFVLRFARIPKRIGFNKSAGSWLFTDVVKYQKSDHEILRNQSLLQSLSINGEPHTPYIEYTEEDRSASSEQLKKWGIETFPNVVGFGPGSKWFTKQWGVERYKQLAISIVNSFDARIVCFGGNEEKKLCEEIVSVDRNRIFNGAGVFSIRESAAALSSVRTVITNDNGFMHIAVAASTPVIALFGPTVPEFGFAPWGESHRVLGKDLYCRPCSIHGGTSCPEKHFRCMSELTPDEVLHVIKERVFS